MRHETTGVAIDISLGALEYEEDLIGRTRTVQKDRLKIPVASPEDMIVLKIIAQRKQDLADIENILDAQDEVDVLLVRRIVQDFAGILERPDIIDDLELLLARYLKKRKK